MENISPFYRCIDIFFSSKYSIDANNNNNKKKAWLTQNINQYTRMMNLHHPNVHIHPPEYYPIPSKDLPFFLQNICYLVSVFPPKIFYHISNIHRFRAEKNINVWWKKMSFTFFFQIYTICELCIYRKIILVHRFLI